MATEPRGSNTFLFADLAGYTALTEAHGDERAADIAAEFCREVRAVLETYAAEEVKSIGDAVMLRADEPDSAIAVAQRLVGDVGARHGALGVRVGMHTGPAVERDGDWFGAAVNLAARVAEVAAAGEVLMTAATRTAASQALAVLDVRPRGRRRFKNVGEPIELFALMLDAEHSAGGLPIDPVCRMAVAPSRAVAALVHGGVEYHFCSAECAGRFRAEPERYLARRADRLDLRVSEDARERVARRLGRAYRRGRLDDAELERRLERTYAATIRADLRAVTHDLPRRRRRRLGPLGLARLIWRSATGPVRRRVRARARNRRLNP
jgi:class 3 adenylate cyclase/YHS domain-containing protein